MHRITGRILCYRLQFSPTEYSFHLNTNSVFDQRKLFRFELNSPFDRGHIILPMLHFNHLPYYERLFNQEVIPSTNRADAYPLSYNLYEITQIPPPCNTRCRHGPSTSECYDVCRLMEYLKFNYSHLHDILPEEVAVKDLQVIYIESRQSQFISRISKKCSKKCIPDSCEVKLAITHISDVRSDSVLNFMVETAHVPITKVVHVAKFQLADYCLQCFSWAGIFISFSIVGIFSFDFSKSKESVDTMKRKLLIIRLDINKLSNSLFHKGYFRGRSTQAVAKLECSNRRIRRQLVPFLLGHTIVTFALLLWQLSNITNNFFLFETTWKFTYQLTYDLELPNTAVCVSLKDLMGVRSDDLNQSNYHTVTRNTDIKLNLTMADMFSSTPGKEILSSCRSRNWNNHLLKMVFHNASACSRIFIFEKIFVAGKIYYIFQPHQPATERFYWRLAQNPINQRTIYSLAPNFGNVKFSLMEFIVYIGYEPPHWSREHSVITSGTHSKKMQFLSYNLYDMKLLPPPYDTRCSRLKGRYDCKQKCYNESVKRINRLSHGELYSVPSHHRIIQYSDLTNKSINDYWVSLEDKCYKKCKGDLCEFNYTTTRLGLEVDRGEFELELVVTSSPSPLTTLLATARVTFYDLLYQLLCSLSFWIGFSLLALDRVKKKDTILLSWKRKLLVQLHRLSYLFTLINNHRVLLKQAERNLKRGKLKKALPALLCFVGCVVHIASSLDYFRYPTILDTIRESDTETLYKFTLCIDPYYFFTAKAALSEGPQLKYREFQMFRSKLLNMSNEEMFKKTHDVKNIIALCRVWGGVDEGRRVNDLSVASDRLLLMETNNTKCHKYFRMDKFFIQKKICYSFTPTVKLEWNRDHLQNVVHDAGLSGCFYMIALNSSLVGSKFNVLATTSDSPMEYSSMWSPHVLEKSNFSRWHIVSYTKYIQQALPPPYSDGGFTHMMHMKCIDLCVNEPLEPFNKSLTSIFTVPSKRRLITFADRVNNATFNTWLNERIEHCERKCKYVKPRNFESKMKFTVTDIKKGRPSKSSTFVDRRGPIHTSFYIRRSDNPVVVIMFKAKISFFEFLITLGSIISIWFGLSVKGIPKSLFQRSPRSVEELIHELRLKMNLLSQSIKIIPPRKFAPNSR